MAAVSRSFGLRVCESQYLSGEIHDWEAFRIGPKHKNCYIRPKRRLYLEKQSIVDDDVVRRQSIDTVSQPRQRLNVLAHSLAHCLVFVVLKYCSSLYGSGMPVYQEE